MDTVKNTLLTFFVAACLSGVSARAEDAAPETFDVNAHGLLDFRYGHVDASPSWLDYGMGKLRYGGPVADVVRVNEAALSLDARMGWDFSGKLTLKYADRQINPVDITEAYLLYRPVSTSAWHFTGRLGLFFPPISLENTGTAWSSPYTLTSSAINTWVGEELRTLGGEAQLNYQAEGGDRMTAFAAGLSGNDTAGTLLAWRGWAMHDYEATLADRLPIPDSEEVHEYFPSQASKTRLISEIDGRPGYYAGLGYERPELLKLRALYYDNRARPDARHGGLYAWNTRFWSLGFKANLPWETTLIGQGMTGETGAGRRVGGLLAIDANFWAWSLLLSKAQGPHVVSLRYDRFSTRQNDFVDDDNNDETGYAWTVHYHYTLAEHHQFAVEWVNIVGKRPGREVFELAPRQSETLWQLGYRWFF